MTDLFWLRTAVWRLSSSTRWNMSSARRKRSKRIALARRRQEARREDIAKAIAKVDQGKGVIIHRPVGGTRPPRHSLMKTDKHRGIAGVNLPMLIRLEGARKVMGVRAAVAAAREAGRKYISVASEILGEAAA